MSCFSCSPMLASVLVSSCKNEFGGCPVIASTAAGGLVDVPVLLEIALTYVGGEAPYSMIRSAVSASCSNDICCVAEPIRMLLTLCGRRLSHNSRKRPSLIGPWYSFRSSASSIDGFLSPSWTPEMRSCAFFTSESAKTLMTVRLRVLNLSVFGGWRKRWPTSVYVAESSCMRSVSKRKASSKTPLMFSQHSNFSMDSSIFLLEIFGISILLKIGLRLGCCCGV